MICNILLTAFLAVSMVQILHETTHAALGLACGASIEVFSLWGVHLGWPSPPGFWQEIVIAGSAALVNIICAGISQVGLATVHGKPLLRLWIFFFGAYSLFMGFGYLLIDPLLFEVKSSGDWVTVIKLLGGLWSIRLPIFVIGCAGTIYGYFWVGNAARHFTLGDRRTGQQRTRVGLLLCLMPYLMWNGVFSLLAFWHPRGISGTLGILLQFWLGYLGFFWAFMIQFVWSTDGSDLEPATPLPETLRTSLLPPVVGLVLLESLLLRGFTWP
jgi:hypothetical protein